MVLIRPFRALHPVSGNAKDIACFPYDVAGDAEARDFAAKNPSSFLRVTRPEIEFPMSHSHSSDEVLDAGKRNLEDLVERGLLVQDAQPNVYIYRLETGTHTQTGVVACCSLDEYESGLIKKHEKTRPDKVAERTKHMVQLRAQTGLILVAFKGNEETQRAIESATSDAPIFEFTCGADIKHTAWLVKDQAAVVKAFAGLNSLYIADGHHRIEAALNARNVIRDRNGSSTDNADYEYVMAGIFPAEELRILPYNRVVRDIGDLSDEELFKRIGESFVISNTKEIPPTDHGDICMYFRGRWHLLHFKVEHDEQADPIEQLDVTILQKYLLAPVLGIGDPRTDDRIGFVGGARGTTELERLVDVGEAAAAFALYPTRMSDLLTVSDMGEVMPPKSTWFEPKLKDGLFVHLI
ncbi:MAG TPA: DUF1015 family protein [Pyrinomonadaceae bacterium]|nr:DUF1015 family protein [Pyrinomonadaceae bacterium]